MKKLKNNWVSKTPATRLYQIPVPIVGLTGGIGTGKSTASLILRSHGIPVIDADILVKNIYQKDEIKTFIQKTFPAAILDDAINFKKLREIVFQNETYKKIIEDTIYSYLPNEFKKAYAEFENPEYIIYDVPLLFEKKLNELIDLTVCVYAPREMQLKRFMSRDNIELSLAEQILNQQMDIEKKKASADLVIDNSNTLKELELEIEKFISIIN